MNTDVTPTPGSEGIETPSAEVNTPAPAAKKTATVKKAAAPKPTAAKKAAPAKPAPKTTTPKATAKPAAKAKAANPAPTATAAPTAKPKAASKPNPSASYIGFSFSSKTPHTLNYRQGKKNIVEAIEVKCTGANATGRRLNVTYTSPDGKSFERRVYKEYFEKAAQVFGAMLPE